MKSLWLRFKKWLAWLRWQDSPAKWGPAEVQIVERWVDALNRRDYAGARRARADLWGEWKARP